MTKSTYFATLSAYLALAVLAEAAVEQNAPQEMKQRKPPSPDLIGHYQVEDAYGVTIDLSGLYWKPREEGLDFVIRNVGTSNIDDDGSVKRAQYNWHWGWRIDFGYQIPQKKMDLNLCWTHYMTKGTNRQKADFPTTLFSVWSVPIGGGIPPVAFEQEAKAFSRLHLNSIDLKMGTTFSPRSFLDITPFIDLCTMWIHQKFIFKLSGGPGLNGHTTLDDRIAMKNDFWGIGPKIGLDTLWSLGYGFGICANFDVSLLYGFFKVRQHEETTFSGLTPPTTFLDIDSNRYHLARLNFDFLLGVRWDKMFRKDRYHLLLEAGWENLIFLGQNQLMRFSSQVNHGNNSSGKGDLTIQGLSMRAAFTF